MIASALTLSAQDAQQKAAAEKRVAEHRTTITTVSDSYRSNATFFTREFDDLKPVKNAPYAADSVTETTQVLADGNRISHKQTASMFRDSEGRTRREQNIEAIGPFAGKGMKLIHISDPVAGAAFTLQPDTKVATKMAPVKLAMPMRTSQAGAPPAGVVTFQRTDAGGHSMDPQIAEATLKAMAEAKSMAASKKESLGKQLMEGLQVEGTRTTHTIAAGEVGNERPIEIVTERWYSPDIQATVMSKTVDPRAGTTIFKLTNVRRNEPSRDLFEVPADYKINEGGRIEMRMERKD